MVNGLRWDLWIPYAIGAIGYVTFVVIIARTVLFGDRFDLPRRGDRTASVMLLAFLVGVPLWTFFATR